MPSKYGQNKRMVKMIKLEKKRKSREKKVLKNSDRRKTSPDISQYKISHPSPNFFLPFFRLRINNSSFRFSYFFFVSFFLNFSVFSICLICLVASPFSSLQVFGLFYLSFFLLSITSLRTLSLHLLCVRVCVSFYFLRIVERL